MLKSERVCGKHFVSGKPAPYWDKHDVDWVPTLQLGKKNFRPKLDPDANAKRAVKGKEARATCCRTTRTRSGRETSKACGEQPSYC